MVCGKAAGEKSNQTPKGMQALFGFLSGVVIGVVYLLTVASLFFKEAVCFAVRAFIQNRPFRHPTVFNTLSHAQ